MAHLRADDVTTPALFAQLCEEVHAGLVEVMKEQLIPAPTDPPTVGEKVPVLHTRRVLSTDAEALAAMNRSPRHLEMRPSGEADEAEEQVERVHAYMVGRGGIDGDGEDKSVGRKAFRLRFIIDSYYEDAGLPDTDEDNAEKRHAAEVARVAYAVFAEQTLYRPGAVLKVSEFRERRGFSKMGTTLVRESLGEVIVDLRAVPLPHP